MYNYNFDADELSLKMRVNTHIRKAKEMKTRRALNDIRRLFLFKSSSFKSILLPLCAF